MPINACLVPAAAFDQQEVVTAEGLGRPGRLHPVQREMAVRGGSQCGYCTPGFICSMAAEYYRPDRHPAGPAAGQNGHGTAAGPRPKDGHRQAAGPHEAWAARAAGQNGHVNGGGLRPGTGRG